MQPGQEATVYLQLMDTAGNIGTSGLGIQASILYVGGATIRVYLPLVMRAR